MNRTEVITAMQFRTRLQFLDVKNDLAHPSFVIAMIQLSARRC
jgi:hypothetical protein